MFQFEIRAYGLCSNLTTFAIFMSIWLACMFSSCTRPAGCSFVLLLFLHPFIHVLIAAPEYVFAVATIMISEIILYSDNSLGRFAV